MFRIPIFRLAPLAAAAWLTLVPAPAEAQKALVYCPVGIDAAGCNTIVAALSAGSTLFPNGVDAGYDGTSGTVDLAGGDLSGYAIFVVPSLADGADVQPYSLLRNGTIAGRIQAQFVGRVAVWSGTPDVGSTNRAAKDNLIRNLAGWAKPDAGGTHGPGVVALQDNSDDPAGRYGWLGGISQISITADNTLDVYSNVEVLNATGTTILTGSNGLQIGYTNMASYGLIPGSGASSNATGGRTSRVVLATAAGEPADNGIATVRTDKEDYAPGQTVTVTGTGWEPGETVTLKFYEDTVLNLNRTISTVADESGNIRNTQFVAQEQDLGVRFVLIATGETSGKSAQTTFTDGQMKVTATAGTTVTISWTKYDGAGSNDQCTAPVGGNGSGTRTVTGPTDGNTASINSGESILLTAPANATTPTGQVFRRWSASGTTFSDGSSTSAANPVCAKGTSGSPTITAEYIPGTILTVSAASGTYGGTASLSATLRRTTDNTLLSGKSVAFTLNGSSAGSATTNASGVATIAAASLVGINAGSYPTGVGASFTAEAALGSSTGTAALTVNAKAVTPSVTANSKAYDGTTAATIATRTLTGVIGTDDVTLTGGTATFATKNVGTGKTVTVTGLTLSGTAAANYVLSSTSATTTADITVKALTPNITISNKVYDATTNASILTRTLTGVIGTEAVTLNGGAAAFADKNVGAGKTVTGSGFTLGGADAGNYVLNPTTATTTATITVAPVAGQFTADNKPYDGNATATIATRSVAGTLLTDVVTLTGGTASFADKQVGAGKTVTATGFTLGGADGGNYTLVPTTLTTTADITVATVTGEFTASNKVYDGTTAATILTRALTGTVSGDVVSLTGGSATFDTKSAGTGKTVTGSGFSLTGADAGNYILASTTLTTTANITAATVTGTITADNKVYDGTTAATLATRTLAGVIGVDVVILSGGTATFANKNVGTGKTVTATGLTLAGADAGNYVLASTTLTTTADIIVRTLTVTATADNKVYDATTAATVTLSDDKVSADAVTVGYMDATFDTKAVGTGKTVTVSGLALSGGDAGNYTLASTSVTITADITPASLAPHITASNRVYDGTMAASILTRSLTGILATDDVSLTGGTATFANKNVGAGKTVTATGFTLSGGDAGNYVLTPATATTTADISQRTLAVTATGQDKVYDRTTDATVTLQDDRVSGDVITLAYTTAVFDTKDAGTAKTVSVSGISLSGGADQGNYQLGNTTATASASITPKDVAPHITADNKVYDGNTSATIASRTLTGVIAPDAVTLNGGTAAFTDKNVGTNKAVNSSGFTLGGTDAANYALTPTTVATTADITRRDLTVLATGVNKVYDGTTDATVTLSDDRVSGDAFTDSYTTATFASKNASNGVAITVSGISISGTDAGNYHLISATGSTSANITAAPLAPAFTASDKVYDGTTAAAIVTRSVTGVITPDVVTLTGGIATFADKNVGTSKTVTASGFGLDGADALNYQVSPPSATTTADITVRPITVTADAQTKVYGNSDPSLTHHVSAGSLAAGDAFAGLLSRAAGEDVIAPGPTYAIVKGTLTAGTNYDLTFVGANLTITQAPLTVTAAAASKVYGDPVPGLSGTLSGAKLGDVFTATYNAYVGGGGMVLVDATTAVGGYPIVPTIAAHPKLGNYSVSYTNATLTITKASLTVAADNALMTFGAASLPALTGSLGGLKNSDPITATYATSATTASPVGAYPITPNLVDPSGKLGNYSVTPTNGTLTISYFTPAGGKQFLQPINPNLTTGNRSSFKIGSTIPTKFQIFKADGVTPVTTATATIKVLKIDSTPETPVNEELLTMPPDDGITFRLSGGQYIYNLGTKSWSAGTYRIIATLNDGSTITAEVDARSK